MSNIEASLMKVFPTTCDWSAFWKTIPVAVWTPASATSVLAATKNLCHLLLLQAETTIVMKQAAELAAQMRDPDHLDELWMNQVELQQLFDVKADVRLDLEVGVEDGRRFVKDDTAEKWQIEFVELVDSLTAEESLLFGPSFACFLLGLGITDVIEVARKIFACQMEQLLSLRGLKAITKENVVTLLSKYAGAKPEKVLANSVFAGLMWAFRKRASSNILQWLTTSQIVLWMLLFEMDVLKLVIIFDEVSGIRWLDYVDLISKYGASSQRDNAVELYEAFQKYRSERKYWMFVKVFDDGEFMDMSYSRHQWFCDFTVYLINLFVNEAQSEISSVDYKIWFNKLISQSATPSQTDVELARSIFEECQKRNKNTCNLL